MSSSKSSETARATHQERGKPPENTKIQRNKAANVTQ